MKEHHPEVYEEARELFEGIDEPGWVFPQHTEVTKDHGRIEKREAWLCTDVSWFAGLTAWAGLMAMGCIRSIRTVKVVMTTELRYYLTRLTDVGEFARSARSHWGIENKLHWVLDAAFREDYARNRKDHSAANLAILRKITLNLLRLEPTEKYGKRKLSPNRKRLSRALKAITRWWRENRHRAKRDQHRELRAKLRGHYGIVRDTPYLRPHRVVLRTGKRDMFQVG